jgi:flagellar biosynthesis protein FlhF
VNQIIEDADKNVHGGNNMDYILSSIYQKMILKFGEPSPIKAEGGKPKVIYFIGPTGVGKTTTIAKIASRCKVESGKRVAFLTADTYRIAATEQLRVYANILGAPMSIIYTAEEMNEAISHLRDYDLIFVDTAGFSHKSETHCMEMKKMLAGLSESYDKEVYLVLSATTKYSDLVEIVDTYKEIADYKLIFTKLDETSTYGNILNIRLHSGAELSYMTNGQNVPDDIEEFNTQKIVKQLLGGS